MKKVLFITYYWPPAGGPGVQRVLKFVKYLPEYGWEPVILTVAKGNFPAIDESLIKEIPEGIKVYRTNIIEPFEIYNKLKGRRSSEKIPTFELESKKNQSLAEKVIKWVRANIFIPDAKIGWIPYIKSEGRKIIEQEKPDLIFSSSPPHALQIGAMKLSQKNKVKWVADFRDPWSTAFWQKDMKRNKISSSLDKFYEKRVLSKANAIITVGNSLTALYKSIYNNNYYTIPNGFDLDDFSNIQRTVNDEFVITYAGTLAASQRIDNFLNAIKNLSAKYPAKIRVNFIGSFHPAILQRINECNISNIIKVESGISHDEILKRICNTNMLLLVIPDVANNKSILTGKLYEYLATGNFILGIGPEDGDAAKILEETNAGQMFDFNKEIELKIEEQINLWLEGKKHQPDETEIKKYTRKSQAEMLAAVFEDVYEN